MCCFFFFHDTATTESYTLSLHDALPISTHLIFSTTNWNADHIVTLTAVDDNESDGTQSFYVNLGADNTTADSNYQGVDPQEEAAAPQDDVSAGCMISAIRGNLTEQGGTATFTVKLLSKPSAAVNIPISVSDTSEATVSGDNFAHLNVSTTRWTAARIASLMAAAAIA